MDLAKQGEIASKGRHVPHEKGTANTVTVHRGASDRSVGVRNTTSAAAAARSVRRTASLEQSLHDQVRNLRIELSDLKIQVSDLAATFGRE